MLHWIQVTMPRSWPTKCKSNPRHRGPISRSGLCPHCGASKMREGGRAGGSKFRKSWYRPPSQLPAARRPFRRMAVKGRVTVHTKRRRTKKDDTAPLKRKLKYDIVEAEYSKFLKAFDDPANDLRRPDDCWDLQVARKWAQAALEKWACPLR